MQVFPTWWGRGQFDSAKSSLHHQEMRGWGQFQPCRCWYSSSTRLETTPPSIFNKTWRKTKFQNYFWQSSFKFCWLHPSSTYWRCRFHEGGCGFSWYHHSSTVILPLLQKFKIDVEQLYPCTCDWERTQVSFLMEFF